MPSEYPKVHLTTRQELHDWFVANHESCRGIWLVSWRSDDLGPRIPYEDVVLECLCFGWIDSTVRTLDEQRGAQQLTPRKRGSVWSRSNKVRLESLLAEDLVQPAGMAVIERAKADGSWTLLDDVDNMVVPDDLTQALAEAGASEQFAALSPSRVKQTLWWIKSAKRDTTRNVRIEQTVAAALRGRSPVA
jgi:uncharacterized protein YdeI (YjbR/CyaY-like superfamily)